MRRTKKIRLLALALAMIMLAPSTAYAAPGRWNSNSWNNNSWNNKSWGNNWNKQDDSSDKTTTTTETELEVVESAETVENPEMLRATTYELTTTETTTTSSTWGLRNTVETVSAEDTIKYFPVTMYNYVANTINAATRAAEDGDELYEGLYFNNGSPGHVEEMVISTSQFVEGQYYIQNMRAKDYGVGSWLKAENGKVVSVNKEDNPTLWTLEVNDDNGTFSLKAEINGSKVYLDLEGTNNGAGDKLVTEKAELEIMEYSHTDAGVQIGKNVDGSYIYLCQFGGNTVTDFGSYHAANDTGNGMQFFKVDENGETAVKLIEKKEIVSGYQEWNHWNKASDDNANGDLMYTGLVAKEMVDDELVFNVPEGGIFNNDDSVKNIYEYVGLPFILDEKTGHYVFDSDAHGVYFEDGKPASGTAEKTNDLIFAKGNPQPFTGSSGDGAINAWYPYNTYTTNEDGNKIYDQAIDYHFGMRADIPFSMTANGRIKGTDDDSKAITFSFSGDDDVWVFIDGKLVIDLGGIHNRLDATIDFAANTITYSEHNTQDPNGDTGSFNDADFSTTQILFTEGNTQGVIAMSRDAFAAKGDHEMQVFYLERGGNTSNCKIEFNLPMNDAVLVTKDATQAWNESAVTEEYDGVEKLTATEQTIINNIDFGFTLYKKDENGFTAVANTNYYLLGRAAGNNQIESTDANGHFYLKNGQSAKFITDIPAEGATYYVIEDTVPKGFITPDFNVDVKAANGFGYFDSIKETAANGKVDAVPELEIPVDAKENRSYAVTAYGSVEANDSVEFICSNFLDAELPNPTALASEDVIVVDYGLPVQIDPLANDMFRGDNVEILYVGGENVTLTENVTAGQLTTARLPVTKM